MAQDFGDDMGNALLNFVTRQTENYLRFGRGRERAFDWWQRHYKKEGNTPEAAKAMAEKQSSREQVVVPFGTSEEAAYYAQVCRENGTYAAAYTDKQGNGFLAFAKEDAKTVAGYAPQFKDVMARLDEQRITDALNHAEPVNKKTMDSLTELTGYPDLPAEDVTVIPVTIRYKDAPDKTYDVLFSEQDTENLNIDDSIFFSGYSHKELTEMVGRETHEDFDVIAVSDPYKVHATQVKTDAPEKTYDVPGKDAPARSDRVATLRAEDTAIHTQNIRNAAQKAREDCTDFSDFERKMNAQGFGVTETSNIGTIPQIEETIAVTRSRNIGITIILQSMSQLESKYDKKAQTIIDCCDSTLFLGGKSNSTNKEIAEMIGKQTIHQMTYNESTGQSSSASKNLQIQGRDLIDAAEIGKMSRLKAILLIAGTNPLMDDKYDPHAHKRYRYIVDKRNWKRLHKNSFDFERYLKNGCEPYTPDEDMGAEFTAWKWAAWKKSRKGLLGKLLNR